MRILGIDPGLAMMGYGVVEVSAGRMKLIAAGAIITKPDQKTPDRLRIIRQDVHDFLLAYKPDEIVFEELFFAKNVTTAMNVGAARGVALCTCAEYTDKLYEYTPMQIKQAVVGYGKADKHQVQRMVKMILGLERVISPDDAADAVAAAITHANTGYSREQFRMK